MIISSHPTKPNSFMKQSTIILGLALIAAAVTGCVVTSIYPFYRTKDVTFDPALMGKWIAENETNSATASEYWLFESNNSQTLKLLTINGGDWRFETNNSHMMKLTTISGDTTNAYDAVLFNLGGAKFLDCLIRERHEMHTPGHILLRVESLAPELKVSPLDYGWLKELVADKPSTLRHILVPGEAGAESSGENLVLTADTAELQKFIRKHLKTEEAWSSPIVMKR
jgi:hypothetical protein